MSALVLFEPRPSLDFVPNKREVRIQEMFARDTRIPGFHTAVVLADLFDLISHRSPCFSFGRRKSPLKSVSPPWSSLALHFLPETNGDLWRRWRQPLSQLATRRPSAPALAIITESINFKLNTRPSKQGVEFLKGDHFFFPHPSAASSRSFPSFSIPFPVAKRTTHHDEFFGIKFVTLLL